MGYRQSTWRAVDRARIWRLPAILAVVGILLMGSLLTRATAVDALVLAIELVSPWESGCGWVRSPTFGGSTSPIGR